MTHFAPLPAAGADVAYLLFSDLHLQWGAWKRRRTLFGDAFYAWQQIVDIACTPRSGGRPLTAVFAAGDLIDDDRPDDFILQTVFDGLDRLAAAGVAFYFVEGNHETLSGRRSEQITTLSRVLRMDHVPRSFFGLHRHARHIDRQTVRLRDATGAPVATVYGLDYQPPDKLSAALQAIPPDADVLLTHQVWKELQGGRGEASLSQLPRPLRVWTGDFHEHRVLTYPIPDAGGAHVVVSPGSCCLQAVNEPPEKAVFAFDATLGDMTSLRLATRDVYEFTVRTAADAAAVPDAIRPPPPDDPRPEPVRSPIVRVRLAADVPGAVAALEAALDGRAHLFVDYAATPGGAAAAVRPVAAGRTVADALLAMGATPADAAAAGLAARAWAAADPDAVVAEYVAAELANPKLEGTHVAEADRA